MVSLPVVDIWEGVGVQSCVWMNICCWRYTAFKHFDFQLDNPMTTVTLWLPPWPPPWWSGACWSGLSPTCATGSTLFSCQSTRSVQSACCQRALRFRNWSFNCAFAVPLALCMFFSFCYEHASRTHILQFKVGPDFLWPLLSAYSGKNVLCNSKIKTFYLFPPKNLLFPCGAVYQFQS